MSHQPFHHSYSLTEKPRQRETGREPVTGKREGLSGPGRTFSNNQWIL
jgi:hypothetical protein